MTPRLVAAFPATGKTWVAENVPGVIDSDSSAFSWMYPATRERHPDWPGNYIAHIRQLLRATSVRYVLVSTHAEVRSALAQAGLPFLLVYPSADLREEYRGRMVRRGSPPALIGKIIGDLWTSALADCERQEGCTRRVLTQGEYLAAVIKGG